MHKKKDLPAMPFYWGDWFKATDVQMLPRDIRCTWIEMLGRMWENESRGEISVNGLCPTIEELAMLLGFGNDLKECQRHIDHLEKRRIFSRKKNGIIFSRKLIKNEQISISRSNAGTKGMESRYNKNYNKIVTNAENENVNENRNIIEDNIDKVINAFNNICGTKYKLKTKATRATIRARIEEGNTVEECISVISKKYEHWKGSEEMAKFIRIETLFRPSKFEGYLNEKRPIKESDAAQKRTDEYLKSIGF